MPISTQLSANTSSTNNLGQREVNLRTYRILWVNDTTPVIINSLVSLGLENYQFTVAHNPEEAVEQLKTGNFDMLLVNLTDRSLAGLDILKLSKKTKPDIIAIAQAEQTDRNILIDALQVGADDFLFVPYNMEEVLFKIFSRLNRQAQWPFDNPNEDAVAICCDCKKIKVRNELDDRLSEWMTLENYLRKRLKLRCKATYCPTCANRTRHESNRSLMDKTPLSFGTLY